MVGEFPFWQQVILGVIAVAGGAAAALVVGWFGRRRVAAETADKIMDASGKVVEQLNERNKQLSDELELQMRKRMDLEDEVARLESRVDALELWIVTNTAHDPADINGGWRGA